MSFQYSMVEEVPVLDLRDDSRSTQLSILDSALSKYGFFYVRNHEINPGPQFEASKALFALDSQEKAKMPFDRNLDIGYAGSGSQNLDPSGLTELPDTKEQFLQSTNSLMQDPDYQLDPDLIFAGSKNFSPPVADYSKVTQAYASAAYQLNNRLNSLLFECLGYHTNPEWVERMGSKPLIILKQMKYVPDSNHPIGAAPHTDWGAFTILATDPTPGLQIRLGDTWLPVPPRRDCLIINAGDQIAQLTANKYRSALHRVVTSHAKQPRYSTAIFTYFNVNAVVKPPGCGGNKNGDKKEQTSLEYFLFKLHESFLE